MPTVVLQSTRHKSLFMFCIVYYCKVFGFIHQQQTHETNFKNYTIKKTNFITFSKIFQPFEKIKL